MTEDCGKEKGGSGKEKRTLRRRGGPWETERRTLGRRSDYSVGPSVEGRPNHKSADSELLRWTLPRA